MRTTFLDS